MKKLSLAVIGLLCSMAVAFAKTPALPLIPLGYCQLSASQLASAVPLSSCVRSTFTASAGSNSNQLVVSAITNGVIKIGDIIQSGTGLTVGTVITGLCARHRRAPDQHRVRTGRERCLCVGLDCLNILMPLAKVA